MANVSNRNWWLVSLDDDYRDSNEERSEPVIRVSRKALSRDAAMEIVDELLMDPKNHKNGYAIRVWRGNRLVARWTYDPVADLFVKDTSVKPIKWRF